MKINVGVIFGGRSVEHEVSVISALQTILAIDKNKYDTTPIYISKEGKWYTGNALLEINNYKNIEKLLNNASAVSLSANFGQNYLVPEKSSILGKKSNIQIDVIFPVIHGTNGEDGTLQGLLELNGIPYAGCNVLSSALGMDKIAAKMVLQASGLPIVNYAWFYYKDWVKSKTANLNKMSHLAYPLIVKPGNLGSSVGISKVNKPEELENAIDYAGSFAQRILIEEAVQDLIEINCAVLGDYEEAIASECEEPVRTGDILSYADKYVSGDKSGSSKGMSGLKRRLPANIDNKLRDEVKQLAIDTFKILGCAGVSRVDFLINDKTKDVYVNEINTIPGSLSFYLWEATGIKFKELTNRIIEIALKQNRERNNLIVSYQTNIFNIQTDSIKLGTKG